MKHLLVISLQYLPNSRMFAICVEPPELTHAEIRNFDRLSRQKGKTGGIRYGDDTISVHRCLAACITVTPCAAVDFKVPTNVCLHYDRYNNHTLDKTQTFRSKLLSTNR